MGFACSADKRRGSGPDGCWTIVPPFLCASLALWFAWSMLLPLFLTDVRYPQKHARKTLSSLMSTVLMPRNPGGGNVAMLWRFIFNILVLRLVFDFFLWTRLVTPEKKSFFRCFFVPPCRSPSLARCAGLPDYVRPQRLPFVPSTRTPCMLSCQTWTFVRCCW